MSMRGKKKWIWIAGTVLVALIIVVLVMKNDQTEEQGPATVTASKTTIVQKALAIGSIEPVDEIAIKSKISGVVGRFFADVGDYIEQGEPLLEVRPDPTPLELAEAKRDVEMKQIELENLERELKRKQELKEKGLISDQEYENLASTYQEAKLRVQIASERLDLLEKGKVRIANTDIETVIKAPINGFILERSVNVGDPVVPLTSYQAGTDLMKMADMKKLVFKGTVDEIDVGKISEGLHCDLQIGALPSADVEGKLDLISLKARKEENTTVFPVEIQITETRGATLRAGFSANADIIIAKKQGVLAIPERVVFFRNDSAFVRMPNPEHEEPIEQYIKVGLSDAIQIEVLDGLEEGDKVLEPNVKEII